MDSISFQPLKFAAAVRWTAVAGLALSLQPLQPLQAQVRINELLASNQTTDSDDFFEFDDWIEFYNPGGIVNLAGYYLTDDPANPTLWQFPTTNPGLTTILPGGFLRVWCDRDLTQGEDHADFKLGGDGETLQLISPDGVTVVDEVTFGPQQTDISYGRVCDGCADWMFFPVPTPLATNQPAPQTTDVLYFNEWQAVNNGTMPNAAGQFLPWLEIFNPNPYQVWLANYTLILEGVGSYTFPTDSPALTTVPAGGFLLVYLDGTGVANHASFLWTPVIPAVNPVFQLLGPEGALVHQLSPAIAPADQSSGAVVDGSPTWINFNQPTPGVTNQLVFVPGGPVRINEVLTSNLTGIIDEAGQLEDWVEIYNPGPQAVDLAGYYFTDTFDDPMRWRVPTGIPEFTVVPAGGFRLFWADDDASQGWNHMTFRFSAVGEHLAFRSPDGFTVVDSLFLPALDPDVSFGRLTDGGLPWVQFLATTPEASNNGSAVGIGETQAPQLPQDPWLLFPNPCQSTGTYVLPTRTRIFDSSGRWVGDFQALSMWSPGAPGTYLMRNLDPQTQEEKRVRRICVVH